MFTSELLPSSGEKYNKNWHLKQGGFTAWVCLAFAAHLCQLKTENYHPYKLQARGRLGR